MAKNKYVDPNLQKFLDRFQDDNIDHVIFEGERGRSLTTLTQLTVWLKLNKYETDPYFLNQMLQISCRSVQIFRNIGTMSCQMMAQVSK